MASSSPRFRRSTPATSMLLALQLAHQRVHELVAPAHQHHEVAGDAAARPCARAARCRSGPWHGPRSAAPAARAAASARRRGAFDGRSCRSRPSRRADQRPELDPAGLVACGCAGGSPRPARRRRCAASSSPNTQSTASSTAGVERKETVRSTGTKSLLGDADAVRRTSRASPRACAGSARWKPKIDCLVSPTAKIVRSRSTAPSPTKNSSVRRRITSHWSGLVSCASSTSTWSMPPSSL